MIRFTVSLSAVLAVVALRDLPERARGGLVAKQMREVGAALGSGEWGLYTSKLDNFANDSKTFPQRYVIDATYWDGKGPVFYEIGGEGTLSGPPGGSIAQMAQNYSALMVALEHR
jgi:hypothetical protein